MPQSVIHVNGCVRDDAQIRPVVPILALYMIQVHGFLLHPRYHGRAGELQLPENGSGTSKMLPVRQENFVSQ